MNIKLIRHATVLLKIKNKTLLIDPVLSAKGTIEAVKDVPNKSNNPLVDLPIPISAIINCDAVLITHTHRDHFDEAAVNALPKDKLIFCQPQEEKKIVIWVLLMLCPLRGTLNGEKLLLQELQQNMVME